MSFSLCLRQAPEQEQDSARELSPRANPAPEAAQGVARHQSVAGRANGLSASSAGTGSSVRTPRIHRKRSGFYYRMQLRRGHNACVALFPPRGLGENKIGALKASAFGNSSKLEVL